MPVPILLYHHVDTPPPANTPSRSNYVHVKNFTRQMYWLKCLGYQGLSLTEAMPYIRGEKDGKVAAITFDDGFKSVYDNAMPVLNALGFHATIFFVDSEMGKQNNWDPPAAKRAPCMTTSELESWVCHGHEAGSHTLTHVHLTQVSNSIAQDEVALSKIGLEEKTQKPILSFAYPYGDENKKIQELVKQAGYEYAVTTRRGRANADDNPYELPRHSIRRNDTIIHFLAKCLLR